MSDTLANDGIEIGAGTAADRSAIEALLRVTGLPLAGLEHAQDTIVARQDGRVVGCAALEIYRDGALLRSVAVDAGLRGTGVGRAVVEAALARAGALGVPAVYLLTVTKAGYYEKFGFATIDRGEVPDTVEASVEFTSACPAGAIVMRRHLGPPIA
jgi:amino-acid N-acetyltransferase